MSDLVYRVSPLARRMRFPVVYTDMPYNQKHPVLRINIIPYVFKGEDYAPGPDERMGDKYVGVVDFVPSHPGSLKNHIPEKVCY
jgi:hypothetical protein